MGDMDVGEAVRRLDRRGGEIQIRATEQGRWLLPGGQFDADFRCIGREDGAAVIEYRRVTIGNPTYRQPMPMLRARRWVLRTDADRTAFTKVVADWFAHANANKEHRSFEYKLRHVDEIDADAGYGQVGCLFAAASTFVGWVVGIVAILVVAGEVSGMGVIVAPIVGLLGGMLTAGAFDAFVVQFPPVRDRIVDVSFGYLSVAPAVLTIIVLAIFTLWPGA